MQRKAKEQEELAMQQERINEGLKELNCEERENFARYDLVHCLSYHFLCRKILSLIQGYCTINPYVNDASLY